MSWKIRKFVAGVVLTACVVIAAHAAGTSETLQAWQKFDGSFEPLIADFKPTLEPVEVLPAPRNAQVTREGEGWLEIGSDGRRVLHLRGTPHAMGVQQGRLLREEVRRMVNTILQTVGMVETLRSGKPFIEQLRATYKRCEPHIPKEYIEEARGLAEGAGLTHEAVLLANIFPELFHCSGFALKGAATRDGKLYHGRILDYMTQLEFQQLAVVTVYQPEGKVPFVTAGFAGFLGSVTGMNAEQVAIGEMGGRGEGQWDGMPMSYLVRKALEDAKSLEDALEIFRTTPRTCEYYYVVSDGETGDARGLAATPERLDEVAPGAAHEKLPHPVKDAVLLSAGSRYERLVMRVEANYGKFGAQEALSLMRRPVAMGSCLHSVLFCPTDLTFWIANATADAQPASEQPYAAYDLRALLRAEPPVEGARP